MSFENGVIRVGLGSPVGLSQGMTLDSLIGGILFQKARDPDKALAGVEHMVEHWHGIPQASLAMLEMPVVPQQVSKIRNMIGHMQRDINFVKRSAPVPKMAYYPTGGLSSTIANFYNAYSTPALWFLVRGNLQEIEQLLRQVQFIGALRKDGFGEITDIDVEIVDDSAPAFGVYGGGSMLRPAPLRIVESLIPAETRHNVRMMTWRNPYRFSHLAETCMTAPEDLPQVLGWGDVSQSAA